MVMIDIVGSVRGRNCEASLGGRFRFHYCTAASGRKGMIGHRAATIVHHCLRLAIGQAEGHVCVVVIICRVKKVILKN